MDSNNKNIVFSGTFLSLNDNAINIDYFKKKIPENTYSIIENKRVHIYKYVYQNNYLRITFGDGSAMPRNPNVYDVETNQTLPNPRQPNQAEPRETFGLIDFTTGFLWLSNSRKRNSLLDFFRTKIEKNSKLVSKDVYDEKRFIETLKKLDDIRLSTVPNLFSQSEEFLQQNLQKKLMVMRQLQHNYIFTIKTNSLEIV